MKSRKRKSTALAIENLQFSFPDTNKPLLDIKSFHILQGTCNLLLGPNGAGKSTLLRILAGKHLVRNGSIRVLEKDPFSTPLSRSEISLVSGHFPITLDIAVAELIAAARSNPDFGGTDLLDELCALLEIDLLWRMHQVSSGQRRRVDLLLALLSNPKVLLLDEVTSDLDVWCRIRVLRWLRKRSEKSQQTIFLATHILDGLEEWNSGVHSQILLLGFGKVLFSGNLEKEARATLEELIPLYAFAADRRPKRESKK